MKGDFTRNTFDKDKHFSRVLMQQGRVQLDADWNEQTAIMLHYLRTLTTDLIGPFAGPESDYGFEITTNDGDDFNIGKGRYYVNGVLCENKKNEKSVTYMTQKYFPSPPELGKQNCLVYLDVWEQHVTALEEDHIREKALGGPDTASRARIVWQVKVEKNIPENSELSKEKVNKIWEELIEIWQPTHRGCLKARVKPPEGAVDPCLTAPDAKYRGHENQLYRVEIQCGGLIKENPTFRWSRDNGSIVTRCVLKFAKLTVDNSRGFAANQWVELTNDEQELRGESGKLVKVIKVDADQLTLDKEVSRPGNIPENEIWPTKVRRWDQREKGEIALVEGAMAVIESESDDGWIELEDGIQIQFCKLQNNGLQQENHYRAGDYWLIPARTATGGIEWPVKLDDKGEPQIDNKRNSIPISMKPHGIDHFYAPLAILKFNNNDWLSPEDCRSKFKWWRTN